MAVEDIWSSNLAGNCGGACMISRARIGKRVFLTQNRARTTAGGDSGDVGMRLTVACAEFQGYPRYACEGAIEPRRQVSETNVDFRGRVRPSLESYMRFPKNSVVRSCFDPGADLVLMSQMDIDIVPTDSLQVLRNQ